VQDYGGELVFGKQTLELSGEKDSWSPPSGSEGGIWQPVDDAYALDGLASSFHCSLEGAPTVWATCLESSEYAFQLSARSNPIQSGVDQPHEQQ